MSQDRETRLAFNTWKSDPLDPEKADTLLRNLHRSRVSMELLPMIENLQPAQLMLDLFPLPNFQDFEDESPTLGSYGIESLEDLTPNRLNQALIDFFTDLQHPVNLDYTIDKDGSLTWSVGSRDNALQLQILLIKKGGVPRGRVYVNQRDINNQEVWSDSLDLGPLLPGGLPVPGGLPEKSTWQPDKVTDYVCAYPVPVIQFLIFRPLAENVKFTYQGKNLTQVKESIREAIKNTDFGADRIEFFKLDIVPDKCNLEYTTWIFAVNGYILDEYADNIEEAGTFYGLVELDNQKGTQEIIAAEESDRFIYSDFLRFLRNNEIAATAPVPKPGSVAQPIKNSIVYLPKNWVINVI